MGLLMLMQCTLIEVFILKFFFNLSQKNFKIDLNSNFILSCLCLTINENKYENLDYLINFFIIIFTSINDLYAYLTFSLGV